MVPTKPTFLSLSSYHNIIYTKFTKLHSTKDITKLQNINFTMEKEINNTLSFLDILIDDTDILFTSVYHKPTFTGLLTNYFSFIPESYQIGLNINRSNI